MLVFGESENDTKSIRSLIEALCPALRGSVEVRRKPTVLIKDARPENVRPQAEQIAKVVAAESALNDVLCVFAHKDCDCTAPGHDAVANAIENALGAALRRQGLRGCAVHAVVPAWELEAWWLLWPELTAGEVSAWRAPTEFVGRDTGKVVNAKETLAQALRPRGLSAADRKRFRDYRESDSPSIAGAIADSGRAVRPQGRNASYQRFARSVAECCPA